MTAVPGDGRFHAGLGTDRPWRRAVDQALDGLTDQGFASTATPRRTGERDPALALDPIGFVYATDVFSADFEAIVARLIEATGIENWVGTIGFGVMADGRAIFDGPGVALMTGWLPRGQATLFDCVIPTNPDDAGLTSAQRQSTALVHVDPRNANALPLLSSITDASGAYLFGGLSASRGGRFDQVAGAVTDGGVSGVLFGPEVRISTGISQGCRPIGPARAITAAREGTILGLDGQSPIAALLTDLGGAGINDMAALGESLYVGLVVSHSDADDFVIRDMTGLDAEAGAIQLGGSLDGVRRAVFCRRDRAAAEADLAMMAKRVRGRIDAPRAAIYVSCLARGGGFFGAPAREAQLLRDALGPVPTIGFYANGEIARDQIYTYTGVLALL